MTYVPFAPKPEKREAKEERSSIFSKEFEDMIKGFEELRKKIERDIEELRKAYSGK